MSKLKEIDRVIVNVLFSFGSYATVGVPIYENYTFTECLKMRSDDIIGYSDGTTFYYINSEEIDNDYEKKKR